MLLVVLYPSWKIDEGSFNEGRWHSYSTLYPHKNARGFIFSGPGPQMVAATEFGDGMTVKDDFIASIDWGEMGIELAVCSLIGGIFFLVLRRV